jgi:hypothetical protein
LGSILYLHTVPPTGGDTIFASQSAHLKDMALEVRDVLEPYAIKGHVPEVLESTALIARRPAAIA